MAEGWQADAVVNRRRAVAELVGSRVVRQAAVLDPVVDATSGLAADVPDALRRGRFPIHFVTALPDPSLVECLVRSGGGVNVPRASLTAALVRDLRAAGLRIGVFGIPPAACLATVHARWRPDLIYLDDGAELIDLGPWATREAA